MAIGFSTNTCLPARNASIATGACRLVGRQMSTASTEIDSQTPKMIVPSDPTAMSTVPETSEGYPSGASVNVYLYDDR